MKQAGHMKNVKLTIEYDGTNFNGWQIQAAGRTIQGEIENAVQTMTRQHIRVIGAGRTDAGVHALGQVAAFRCETRLTAESFFSGLNGLLPQDIVVRSVEPVANDFHPRFDATGKTYVYRVLNRPLRAAVGRSYCWHVKKPLNIAAMKASIQHIAGTHDFKAFENTGSPRSHTVRTVAAAEIFTATEAGNCDVAYSAQFPLEGPDRDMIFITIRADGFLRYMVRNIVATLVDVGLEKRTPEDFAAVLRKKDRSLASATAPPQGLFLASVDYGRPLEDRA